MSDIPTVTYYAYSGTRYIGQYSGEDSAVLAFIAGKGYTTGPKPLATDRDLWVSIVADATAAAEAAEDAASGLEGPTAKLAGIEEGADVTDTANVTAAGALMDIEVTNLADVKAFDPADYADAIHTHEISDVTGLQSALDGKAATGDVFSGAYADLTGKPTLGTAAALDVGTTASKVVQLDGSGKLPAVDGSQLTNIASGLALISTSEITSAVASVVIPVSGYSSYQIRFYSVVPATNNAYLSLRVSDDGGATFTTGTTYYWNLTTLYNGINTNRTADSTLLRISGGVSNNAVEGGANGFLDMTPGTASNYPMFYGCVNRDVAVESIAGTETSTGEVDAVQVFFSSGNIVSGVISLFGISEA